MFAVYIKNVKLFGKFSHQVKSSSDSPVFSVSIHISRNKYYVGILLFNFADQAAVAFAKNSSVQVAQVYNGNFITYFFTANFRFTYAKCKIIVPPCRKQNDDDNHHPLSDFFAAAFLLSFLFQAIFP